MNSDKVYSRVHKVTVGTAVLFLAAACWSHLQAADLDRFTPPEVGWFTSANVTIPIGCLSDPECVSRNFVGTSNPKSTNSGLEGAPTSRSYNDQIGQLASTSADAVITTKILTQASQLSVAREALQLLRSGMSERKNRLCYPIKKQDDSAADGREGIGPNSDESTPPTSLSSALVAYSKSDTCKWCRTTFSKLREQVARPSNQRNLSLEAKLYSHYVASCFQFGAEKLLKQAADRLVILLRKRAGSRPFSYCMGFNIKKNYVLTAKHCLVETTAIDIVTDIFERDDPEAFISIRNPIPGTLAVIVGEPGINYELTVPTPTDFTQDLDFYPFKSETDYAILKINASRIRAKKISSYPVGNMKNWDRVIIPGFFGEDRFIGLKVAGSLAGNAPNILEQSIAADTAPTCYIRSQRTNPKLYLHSCQTRSGFSGAPIFRFDDGRPVLVGIHLGAASKVDRLSEEELANIYPNFGLSMSGMPLVRDLSLTGTSD